MTTPFDAAAAAAGLFSLTFQAFQGCVGAFNFFNTAAHIGADGSLFSSKLQWEQYRLVEWGNKAGLGEIGRPNSKLNWQIAYSLLQQFESLMTSAEELKTRYRLEVTEEAIEESERLSVAKPPQKGVGKLIARLRPEIYATTGRVIQANNNTMKRLRWATMGIGQANRIIRDISDLNQKLHQLLDSIDQERRDYVDALLLRDIISRSSSAIDVEQIKEILEPSPSPTNKSIQAAASLKQIRLVIGVDKRDDEVGTAPTEKTKGSMPLIRKLKYKKLLPYMTETPMRESGIEFARYDCKPVLVEWKVAEGPMWQQLFNQVRNLAVLLTSEVGKTFRSLPCIGYLPWEEKERYALVYDIPDASTEDSKAHWRMKSLYDLLSEQPILSLSRRYQIATGMAEVILQLHTAGWLHKSFRSDNIIFLSPTGSTTADFLNRSPYLVGYGYARPDTPDAAIFTQLPDTVLRTDLYRHPQARGIPRQRYQKRFDMYAFGCLLVELALWKRLTDIQSTYRSIDINKVIADAAASNAEIELPSLLELPSREQYVDELKHYAGEAFVEAIKLSLLMETKVEEGQDASLDTQQAVLEKLRQCKC
ncbi:hypothetical protein CC78DRAFT_538390 [Lojkania enalia]|uniref:Protein kinase domain-containing protein n=1 Tax=Lojkania enalia TaxID=147567 RepID=A0A9P4JZ45_9PLEO|nr:hypothetical protein CC78DRAFT_538390 [Didymosphaeria enalia]